MPSKPDASDPVGAEEGRAHGPQCCPLTAPLARRDEVRNPSPSSIREPVWDISSDPRGSHTQANVSNFCPWL